MDYASAAQLQEGRCDVEDSPKWGVLYLAVGLHDTHGKCAYLQVAKHPSFTLEHKHTLQNSNCIFLVPPVGLEPTLGGF